MEQIATLPMTTCDEWLTFENAYWDFQFRLDEMKYLRPTNIESEKSRFLAAVDSQEYYDPVFTYREAIPGIREALVSLLAHSAILPSPLREWYREHINNDLDDACHFSDRNTPDFPNWLSGLYGAPPPELVDAAREMLADGGEAMSTLESRRDVVNADAALTFFANALEKVAPDWLAKKDEIAARISVNSTTKTLTINKYATFTEVEFQRFLVHELGVHVRRSENGGCFPFRILRHGLPKYLETEEGLAAVAEERLGMADMVLRRRYAWRVLACEFALECGFADCFFRLRELGCPEEEAFPITLRVKRGLTETGRLGGYTKDQVYLAGCRKLRDAPDSLLATLFLGKIGIQHTVNFVNCDAPAGVVIPDWLDPPREKIGE